MDLKGLLFWGILAVGLLGLALTASAHDDENPVGLSLLFQNSIMAPVTLGEKRVWKLVREAQSLAAQPAHGPEPERALSRHVDGLGRKRTDSRNGLPGIVREAQLRVRGQGDRAMGMRIDDKHLYPLGLETRHQLHERVGNAIRLRLPGIGDQSKAAGAKAEAPSSGSEPIGPESGAS